MAVNARTRRALEGPDPFDVKVGENVKALRLHRDMSQQHLAGLVGVTFQQLQKYEKAQNRISCSMLKRLADSLNVTMATILGETESAEVAVLTAYCPTQLQLAERIGRMTPAQQRIVFAMIEEWRSPVAANG